MDSLLSRILAEVRPASVRQKVAALDVDRFAVPHATTLLVSTLFCLVNIALLPLLHLALTLSFCARPGCSMKALCLTDGYIQCERKGASSG